jgi:hypothetical protein
MTIKLTLKGLAKYIASSPSAQRKILQDFKYPSADEPFAMRMYYREATDCLKEYVRERHSSEWLRQRAIQLTAEREGQSATSARRLRQNAEAVLLYEKHFGSKELEVLSTPKFRLSFHDVAVSVVPDLCLRDGTKTKLIKLQFGGTKLAEQSLRVITHCQLVAANSQGFDLGPSSVIYLDLPRGVAHTAPRAGKRTLQDIRAACETISQIWESIPPPGRSKRSAAA